MDMFRLHHASSAQDSEQTGLAPIAIFPDGSVYWTPELRKPTESDPPPTATIPRENLQQTNESDTPQTTEAPTRRTYVIHYHAHRDRIQEVLIGLGLVMITVGFLTWSSQWFVQAQEACPTEEGLIADGEMSGPLGCDRKVMVN